MKGQSICLTQFTFYDSHFHWLTISVQIIDWTPDYADE